MLEGATSGSVDLDSRAAPGRSKSFLTRKIWLPKPLYAALPYFYMLVGVLALAATIYISEWFWVVPHYILFSAACLHMGILISRRRYRRRDESE